MPTRIEISYKTILFTILTILSLWLIWQLKDVVFLLFIALILVSALHSPVDFLCKKKVPRVLAIFLIYTLLIIMLAIASLIIVPALNEQYRSLIQQAPYLINNLNRLLVFVQIPSDQVVASLSQPFAAVGKNLFKITTGAVGTLVGLITLLVLTFYLLLDWSKVVKLLASPFSGHQERLVVALINDIEKSLGGWLRGQLSLSFIVGLLVFGGLTALGVPSALALALIAGILEIVPIIGPILSAIPAIIIALTISPIVAVATAALYFVIQQLENNLIVPTVMAKAVGVNPVVTILALMVGAKLAGIVGIILAVPSVVVVKIVFRDLVFAEKDKQIDEGSN